jgi:membrane protease subunit (stomatin/prohibitin family)
MIKVTVQLITQLILVSGHPATYTSIADSGATVHFLPVNALVVNKKIAAGLLAIYNFNGGMMCSTHTAEIDVPQSS